MNELIQPIDENGNKMFTQFVVESGDGYVRFADGTQIEYGSFSTSNLNFGAWGNVYGCDVNKQVNFHKSFIRTPSVNLFVVAYPAIITQVNGTTSARLCASFTLMKPTPATSVELTVAYLAIGRWK